MEGRRDPRPRRGLTRAQQTLLEAAAQKWVVASSLADYIARQPTLVTKKRTVIPVVGQYLQVTDSLERTLDRLALERCEQPVEDLDQYLARRAREQAEAKASESDGETGSAVPPAK